MARSKAVLTEVLVGVLTGGVQFALLAMATSITGYGAQLTLAFGLFVSLPTFASLVVGTAVYAQQAGLTQAAFFRLWALTFLALGLAVTAYEGEFSRKDRILNQWEREKLAAKYENVPGPLLVQDRSLASDKWIRLEGTPIWDNEGDSAMDGHPRLKFDGYKLRPGQYLAIQFVEQKMTPEGEVQKITPGPTLSVPIPDYKYVDAAMNPSKGTAKPSIVPRQVGLTLYLYPDHIETGVFFGLSEVTIYEPQRGDPHTTVNLLNHSGQIISRISVNGWDQAA